MSHPQIAVQLYALKDAWWADRARTLEQVAQLGIQGIEAFAVGDTVLSTAERLASADNTAALVAAHGLEMVSAHIPLPALDDADWMFEEVARLGAPLAIASTTERILGFTRDALASPERAARVADRLNSLAEIGLQHGVGIGYHNHWWEWDDSDGKPGYDRLLDDLDPRIVLEIDLFWAYAASQDLAELVGRYAQRVQLVHVKDGDGRQGTPQVAAGTGAVPLAAALDAAQHLRWAVLEVDTVGDADVWDVIGAGADWLRSGQDLHTTH